MCIICIIFIRSTVRSAHRQTIVQNGSWWYTIQAKLNMYIVQAGDSEWNLRSDKYSGILISICFEFQHSPRYDSRENEYRSVVCWRVSESVCEKWTLHGICMRNRNEWNPFYCGRYNAIVSVRQKLLRTYAELGFARAVAAASESTNSDASVDCSWKIGNSRITWNGIYICIRILWTQCNFKRRLNQNQYFCNIYCRNDGVCQSELCNIELSVLAMTVHKQCMTVRMVVRLSTCRPLYTLSVKVFAIRNVYLNAEKRMHVPIFYCTYPHNSMQFTSASKPLEIKLKFSFAKWQTIAAVHILCEPCVCENVPSYHNHI